MKTSMAAFTERATIKQVEQVMGTVVSIDVRPGNVPGPAVYIATAEARAVLHRADAVFSTWKHQSPMSRIRRGEQDVEHAPADVAEVLGRCELARSLSAGWFDPWALPGGVDPTGLVKGWAAQRALRRLMDAGIAAAMVNAGGDVAVAGQPEPGRPWRIGIRDPWNPRSVVAVVEADAGVATSGAYERGQHVIDPHLGRPASAVASATVTGPALDLADAWATALLARGEAGFAWLEAIDGYEGFVVRHDGSTAQTGGFPRLRS